jgi:hypothetical protein
MLRNASDATGDSLGIAYPNNGNSNYNSTGRKHNNAVSALGYSYCQGPDLSALRNALCAAIDMHFSNDGSVRKVTMQLLYFTMFMTAISSGKRCVTTEPLWCCTVGKSQGWKGESKAGLRAWNRGDTRKRSSVLLDVMTLRNKTIWLNDQQGGDGGRAPDWLCVG